MTTTDESMTHPAEPVGVPVAGWQRPAWAEDVHRNGNDVTFQRVARRIPLVYTGPDASEGEELIPHPVELIRNDVLHIGADATIRVESEAVCVYLGDMEQVPVSQARVLAEALLELADHAEGVASA